MMSVVKKLCGLSLKAVVLAVVAFSVNAESNTIKIKNKTKLANSELFVAEVVPNSDRVHFDQSDWQPLSNFALDYDKNGEEYIKFTPVVGRFLSFNIIVRNVDGSIRSASNDNMFYACVADQIAVGTGSITWDKVQGCPNGLSQASVLEYDVSDPDKAEFVVISAPKNTVVDIILPVTDVMIEQAGGTQSDKDMLENFKNLWNEL